MIEWWEEGATSTHTLTTADLIATANKLAEQKRIPPHGTAENPHLTTSSGAYCLDCGMPRPM